MPKRKDDTNKQPEELKLFHDLSAYANRQSQGTMRLGRFYSNCVRASFAKCYEFNIYAWDNANTSSAFFWLPTLRGICEDLIILNYIQIIPSAQREELMANLMSHELHSRLKTQHAFFSNNRPHQEVLVPSSTLAAIEALEQDIRLVWQAHGWPNMNRGVVPPTRQLAEKRGGDVLATLYDYLYRLTSSTVHFSVNGLLRTGWGDPPNCKFSPEHFGDYYVAFGRIYGAFMFCSYFELLARFLRTDASTKETIQRIRESILSELRWPEMTTFEEMNLQRPKMTLVQTLVGFNRAATAKRLLDK